MKTQNESINEVLSKNATSFFIPPFQRSYAWRKTEIERYFNDVVRIIKSELNTDEKDKLEHFFGTVVISKEDKGFATKSVIVDGQQRLTTTLIFLIALRNLESQDKNKEYITNNFLKNNASSFEDKIKLKQVTKDWDSYKALVNGTESNPGIIKTAYQIFKKLIKDNLHQFKFEHYIKAIQRMNVALIFLDERPYKGEDPQIIFETLNSLGRPLTLADLIRNFILLRLKSNEQTEIYEKVWHPKIESILNDYTSKFFRDYLQYKLSISINVVSDNNTKEVYQIFKDFAEDKFGNRENFINDIARFVPWYKWIITEIVSDIISPDVAKDKEIKELIRNIFHDIKAEAFKPFVLGLFEYQQEGVNGIKLSDDNLIYILKTIRTYLIRRRILNLTAGENKSIVLHCKRIGDLAKSTVSMLKLLSEQMYNLRMPNDNEIIAKLKEVNFYKELTSYSKFILGKIEENNAKVSVNFRDKKITIEHIMPQTLTSTWNSELGENHDNIHKTYLDNIGNLILTEFNSEIGNKSFKSKQEKLMTSSLNYRLDIIKCSSWNERDILNHQGKMIQWLLDTFPLSAEYKSEKNWNEKIIENTKFSPLDDDAGDIAQGKKPTKLLIDSKNINVKTWQEVFIEFLKWIRNNPDYDFSSIIDNQDKLLGRDIIIKLSRLKDLIEEKDKKKYKTFDGVTLHELPNQLNDDLEFIHINASAETLIERVAKIMELFNMPENLIEIVLK